MINRNELSTSEDLEDLDDSEDWGGEDEVGLWALPRDERDRNLTPYEHSEIVQLEGFKPAHMVAEEFRIHSCRVRNIWDGVEL